MLTDNATAFWLESVPVRKAHTGKVICGQDVGFVVPRSIDKQLGLFPILGPYFESFLICISKNFSGNGGNQRPHSPRNAFSPPNKNPRKARHEATFRGFYFGATDPIRTDDLLITSELLYRLSHSSILKCCNMWYSIIKAGSCQDFRGKFLENPAAEADWSAGRLQSCSPQEAAQRNPAEAAASG